MKTILQLLSFILFAVWLFGFILMVLPPVFHAVLMLSAILMLRSIFITKHVHEKVPIAEVQVAAQ